MKSYEVAPNVNLPEIGIGTWQIRDRDTIFQVLDGGLGVGFRLIDTAAAYQNESMIADALDILLPKYGLTRQDIFFTSKLSCNSQGAANARKGAEESLRQLRLDFIDLFLIHWPGVTKLSHSSPLNAQLRKESWIQLEDMLDEGKFQAIGVSNYEQRHLEELLKFARVRPAVNQCEFHPHFRCPELVAFCRANHICFQAYSSFGSPESGQRLNGEPRVCQLATKHNCSAHQLLLAWALCQDVPVLPRSSNAKHVIDNFRAINIKLDPEDFECLSVLEQKKYCWDPSAIL